MKYAWFFNLFQATSTSFMVGECQNLKNKTECTRHLESTFPCIKKKMREREREIWHCLTRIKTIWKCVEKTQTRSVDQWYNNYTWLSTADVSTATKLKGNRRYEYFWKFRKTKSWCWAYLQQIVINASNEKKKKGQRIHYTWTFEEAPVIAYLHEITIVMFYTRCLQGHHLSASRFRLFSSQPMS